MRIWRAFLGKTFLLAASQVASAVESPSGLCVVRSPLLVDPYRPAIGEIADDGAELMNKTGS